MQARKKQDVLVAAPGLDTGLDAGLGAGLQAAITVQSLLTPRQLAVARLIAFGLPNKSIAYELGIDVCTVKSHVTKLLKAFRVPNRTSLALLVRDCMEQPGGNRRLAGILPESTKDTGTVPANPAEALKVG